LRIKNIITALILKSLHNRLREGIYQRHGKKFYICKRVFSPLNTITPDFLIEHLHLKPSWNVLDMGTGIGYIPIQIAEKVRRITAVDINPYAIHCAEINIRLNNLQDKIRVIRSDLFSSLTTEKFDSIIFNPPYLTGQPTSYLEASWYHPNPIKLILKFLSQAKQHIPKHGLIQICYSSLGPLDEIQSIFENNGYTLVKYYEKNIVWEKIRALIFRKN